MKQLIFFTSLFYSSNFLLNNLVNTTSKMVFKRTLHAELLAVIEDRSIETIVAVNLKAENQAFRKLVSMWLATMV